MYRETRPRRTNSQRGKVLSRWHTPALQQQIEPQPMPLLLSSAAATWNRGTLHCRFEGTRRQSTARYSALSARSVLPLLLSGGVLLSGGACLVHYVVHGVFDRMASVPWCRLVRYILHRTWPPAACAGRCVAVPLEGPFGRAVCCRPVLLCTYRAALSSETGPGVSESERRATGGCLRCCPSCPRVPL